MAPPPQPPIQESTPFTLLGPLRLLYFSATYIPLTILHLLKTSNLAPLTSISLFKEIWFARFWTWFGPRAAENAAPKVTPLIQNNASGTVLDIGPGSGQWLFLYARALNPSITKIYGVEPNVGLHAELRANAVKAGLEGVYEVIGCGAEELSVKGGVQKGSVDTIVTVQCLCSIPGPERVIGDLYPLLREGGKWIVYEHVRTKYQGDFVGGWQSESLFFDLSSFW
jgi:SAM-dependent methyltransferase